MYVHNDYEGTDDAYLSLTPFQVIFGKSLFSILTLIVWLNVSLKKNVYNGINRGNVNPLIFRTIQGSVSNMINYSVAKYVPSSIISTVNALSPIITVVFAYLILKEIVMWFDVFICGLNFTAILTTILGADPDDNSDKLATPPFSMWIIYALLLINPFLSSGGTIAMRKMKKFSEYVVSWYMNWCILLTALIILGI